MLPKRRQYKTNRRNKRKVHIKVQTSEPKRKHRLHNRRLQQTVPKQVV